MLNIIKEEGENGDTQNKVNNMEMDTRCMQKIKIRIRKNGTTKIIIIANRKKRENKKL